MIDPHAIVDAVTKIDLALQQVEQALKERPGNMTLEMAKASLEGARADLTGKTAY